MTDLAVWYARMDIEKVLADMGKQLKLADATRADKTMASGQRPCRKMLAKAKTRDSMQALSKLTQTVDGELRIISDPPLIVPIEELLPEDQSERFTESLQALLRNYRKTLQTDRQHLLRQFRLVHMARKVVGVGSVGTRAWILLLLGSNGQEPLLLQAKEAQESVLARFVGRSRYANQGARVVAGQHLMQASSDIFLGWEKVVGLDGVTRDFYVRQLRDWKGSADTDVMVPQGMALYGQLCGWTLARAHARSGDRVAIDAYLGGGKAFDSAIASFSESYADQNERDYDALEGGGGRGADRRPVRPLIEGNHPEWVMAAASEAPMMESSLERGGPMTVGPVEYIVVGFPGNNFTGEIAPELAKLVTSGAIRILDLLFIGKDAAGDVIVVEVNELRCGQRVWNTRRRGGRDHRARRRRARRRGPRAELVGRAAGLGGPVGRTVRQCRAKSRRRPARGRSYSSRTDRVSDGGLAAVRLGEGERRCSGDDRSPELRLVRP